VLEQFDSIKRLVVLSSRSPNRCCERVRDGPLRSRLRGDAARGCEGYEIETALSAISIR
jgi:hypothetical protein